MKEAFNFLALQIHHLMMREREIDLRTFVDEEEGDIDYESDVELDGNDQLDLDLDSEHNDDDLESDLLSDSEDRAGSAEESDLLSDSEDRAGSAEEFQWSPNS